MKKIIKKLITLVAALAMILPIGALLACVDSGDSKSTGTTNSTTTTGTTGSDGTTNSTGTTSNKGTKKERDITKALTDGNQFVPSSRTGIIFEIDLSEYLESNEITNISFSVSYDLKVKDHYLPGDKPRWFDFKFYSKNMVNDVYKIGEAVCEWGGGEYAGVSDISFNADLNGNKVYVAADSNTWLPGYSVYNFSVNMKFTDII